MRGQYDGQSAGRTIPAPMEASSQDCRRTNLPVLRPIIGERAQLTITAIAVGVVFYIRLTRLPGASPYELFLLLSILIAILFRPKALLASFGSGFVGAHLLIWLEARSFLTAGYWKLTTAYLIFSGLLLVFNHLGHKLSARVFREQRLKEAIVSSSLDAITTLDSAGRFVTFNTAAVRMFGYSRQEVTGRRILDFIIPPQLRHMLEGTFSNEELAEQSGIRNRRLEMHAVKRDGTVFPIELAIVKVELPEGVFYVAHIRDITERKAFEQEREKLLAEAEKANDLKTDLLANLSHEFRTPLNAILGWSRMLRHSQVPPDRLSHVAEVIERNAQTQSRLVDDLLDASLAVAGVIPLEMSKVDVAAALRAAAESIRLAAEAGALVVECHAPANLGTIHADRARLHQVLLNLLSNAVKFTSAGGTITLDALKGDGVVTIRVADTGVGIRPDFLPFVFERFRQADTSTTRSHRGLGLGLAVVKHLVAAMGGEITAHSDGVGKGASFSLRFRSFEGDQIQRPQPSGSLSSN